MTAKELFETKIIPLRRELNRLEEEWEYLNRLEKGKVAGFEWPTCDNCAYSCVLMIDDHNVCLGGRCTCCNDYCHKWIPENSVSNYLREHYPYGEGVVFRLKELFGDDFLECDDVNLILRALRLMDEVREKVKENNK